MLQVVGILNETVFVFEHVGIIGEFLPHRLRTNLIITQESKPSSPDVLPLGDRERFVSIPALVSR